MPLVITLTRIKEKCVTLETLLFNKRSISEGVPVRTASLPCLKHLLLNLALREAEAEGTL